MTLPDHLHGTVNQIMQLRGQAGVKAAAMLEYVVQTLGYNDAGLVCAYFRGRGDTTIAEYIEVRRFN